MMAPAALGRPGARWAAPVAFQRGGTEMLKEKVTRGIHLEPLGIDEGERE